MIEFLQSLRSDLFSRRLLPFVALAGVALIAAVAYTVTGGSGSSTPAPVASLPSIPVTGSAPVLPVTVAPSNPNEAVSETPGGTRYQSQGSTRDPFIPLPSPPATKTAGTSSASGSSSSSTAGSTGSSSGGGSTSGSGGSSGKGSGGGQEAPVPAPKKQSKPKFPYVVSILFGPASSTPGQPATLTPFESIKPGELFPSKHNPRISFERVASNGAGAVFKLVSPPILHGTGICLPSTSECQTIDLEAGHSEELEYIEANGQGVVYELKLVSITKGSGASAASVKHRRAHAARARRKAPRA
ncbi:MAG TPA: hypothetical protein VNU24_06675 [Solirubrobacteraceae bacterium]|jgi:hypothetical protein|nr:hypothetical protein [Solirubrobacteraceae bacterium]